MGPGEKERTVTAMVYEIIGKMVIYIIVTVLFGAIFAAIEGDWGDNGAIFFGAWIASVLVFLWLMIQQTQ